MAALSELERARKKELVTAATRLYKSGVRPTAVVEGTLTRAQQRQFQRALGYRGSKAKSHRNMDRRLGTFSQVLLAEQALDIAQARVEHPIRSRLKR